MNNRWTHGRTALHGIALVLALTSVAAAQSAPGDEAEPSEDEQAECMASREPHECADRCPNYDTCFLPDEGLLYYQVEDARFDCDGLDCAAASVTLGDYCCRRGEYAPGSDDDGGCTVRGENQGPQLPHGAVALGALAALAAWRKRRAMTRGERSRR